jgi:predicted DNA-binding transcriptional regulator AlpA
MKLDHTTCNLVVPTAETRQPLLTERQLAAQLNISVKTLQNWRWLGRGPKFIKLNGDSLVRYRQSDVDAYLEAQVRASTSDGEH